MPFEAVLLFNSFGWNELFYKGFCQKPVKHFPAPDIFTPRTMGYHLIYFCKIPGKSGTFTIQASGWKLFIQVYHTLVGHLWVREEAHALFPK
jgi:hypothetical protein